MKRNYKTSILDTRPQGFIGLSRYKVLYCNSGVCGIIGPKNAGISYKTLKSDEKTRFLQLSDEKTRILQLSDTKNTNFRIIGLKKHEF